MASIDIPGHLVELLFLRAVWGIEVPDGPPPCSVPPEPIGAGPKGFSPAQATAAWQGLWREGVDWRPDGFPPSTSPPLWRERYGVAGVEEGARAWISARRSEVHELVFAATLRPRGAQVMAQAEREGVHSIVALPLAAPWVSWTRDGRVLLSGSAFATDELLAEALIDR